MTGETIKKLTVAFGLLISLTSSLLALLTGGDVFFVLVERFFIVFGVSAFLVWSVLTVINTIVIGAARESVDKLVQESEKEAAAATKEAQGLADVLKKAQEEASKGLNLDLTSEPQDDVFSPDVNASPEIKEFEPFKPKRIETDTDNVAQ